MICIASSILVFVTCVAVAGLYYGAERIEADSKFISVTSQASETRRLAEKDRLMLEAHWETYTDAGGDLVIDRKLKLPIDEAMQIIVDRNAQQGAAAKK